MIDGLGCAFGGVQGGDGQRVDLVRQHGLRADAQHRLHLCQDHPEMRHRDDMGDWMRRLDPADGHGDAGGRGIPAFAAGWAVIAGGFPIGAAEVGVPVGHRGKVHAVPAAEMKLADSGPQPILLGRHLIAQGMEPSKAFKGVLEAAFEAQIEGEFFDEVGAVEWLKRTINRNSRYNID